MDINAALQLTTNDASPAEAKDDARKQLAAYFNQLIADDFPALVQALYRMDVSERKLKAVLKENPAADAGDLIAEMMMERERQKKISRDTYTSNNIPPGDEERW